MKTLRTLLTIVLIMSASKSVAQLKLNTLSVNVGTIRTFFPDGFIYSKYQYAFYPEFQAGGDFFTSYFQWTAYLGFWDDGIDQVLPVADMVTYSYKTRVVGIRINFLPDNIARNSLLPTGVFAGIAHHFISVDYVDGYGYDGKPGQSHNLNSNTFEFGINADYHLVGFMYIRGEVHQYFPLGNEYIDTMQKNRRSYKVGIAFKL